MITAMSLTNGTLTVIIDNGSQILTARNDHPRWSEILDAYKNGNKQRLETLVSIQAVVEEYSVGALSVNATGVTYRGQPMHSVDSDRVMAFLREGLPYRPLANYMANKMLNPSARAISEMYTFLEHKGMPIDDDGYIIAYKGVCDDFFSVYGNLQTVVIQGQVDANGRLLNKVGATIEVERSSVDDDYLKGCSFGLHAGSLAYASGHANKIVLVRINPADVVSVPSDCNCQKLRCCKYTVIGEFTGKLPNTYTNEYATTDAVADDVTPEDSDADADDYARHTDDGYCDCDDCAYDRNTLAESEESNIEVDKKDNGQVKITFGSDVADSTYISDRLKEIVSEQFGVPLYKITDASTPLEMNLDSLDQVELEMAIEEEFGILFDFDKDYHLANFGELVKLVRSMISVLDITAKHVYSDNDTTEDSYLKGMNDGVADRAKGITARFLAGDQVDVETAAYAKYIDGYLAGYL